MDNFTLAYLHAAAFTEDPDPGQGEYPAPALSDYDPAFLVDAAADCAVFQERAENLLTVLETPIEWDDEQAGRDFWYTRNRHGCGFWDGDWPEPAAGILTDLAHSFGECSVMPEDVCPSFAVED